jgi:NADH:ubiquinone oxidoreductase subunit 4 (subunit M)
MSLLVSWNSVTYNLKEFLIAFNFDFFLIGVFCVLDLLLLYFLSVLIPMYMIGIWGSRDRKS